MTMTQLYHSPAGDHWAGDGFRIASHLGGLFRRERERADLSQTDLARRAGISRNHLQLLEDGLGNRARQSPGNPRLSTFISLCRALDLDPAEVLREVLAFMEDR